jgi:hypothetical protein
VEWKISGLLGTLWYLYLKMKKIVE